MRSAPLLFAIGLALTSPLSAQQPVRPRPAEPPSAPTHPRALAAESFALDAALAPLAIALPSALEAAGVVLPHALEAAHMGLLAADLALPLALDAVPLAALDADAFADDFADLEADAPEPWAPQDPADSLYRMARRALNDENYSRAAELFSRIRQDARYRGSEYRAIAFYYEAFARSRMGGRAELQRARAALDAMRTSHAEAWREQAAAPSLLARIDSELARLGDATAARAIQTRGSAVSRDPCTDANMGVKVEALNALLQMDAPNAMPILEEVLKNRSTEACPVELRRRALFIMSQKRTDRTAEILLEAARNDPSPDVQEQAVFWLSQVNSPEALAALESVLRTATNRKLQERAVFAISQQRDPRAAALLRDYVLRADAPADLRGNALFWIGQRNDPEDARFLREVYPRLTDRELKEKLISAFGQQQSRESAEWLLARANDRNEDVEIRKNALFWAGQQRALPLATINRLYGESEPELKKQLLFVLSQRAQDPEAVTALIGIARNEQDPELRKQAIFWLGQSRDPRAAAFLLELVKG